MLVVVAYASLGMVVWVLGVIGVGLVVVVVGVVVLVVVEVGGVGGNCSRRLANRLLFLRRSSCI